MESQRNQMPPKVFISYSWTTREHEQWVYDLAERLASNSGVDVKLDKWDLKEGQDKYAFMESMVTSKEIERVLIICDKGYMEKANANSGGVGTEKGFITPEVMENVEQTKFIPIVAERNEAGGAFIPTFLRTRMYIDLTDSDDYEENYEQLVRLIYNARLHKRPSIGERPAFLDEANVVNRSQTASTIVETRIAIERRPAQIRSLKIKFAEGLYSELKRLEITNANLEGRELDDVVFEKINLFLPIRDDYINFILLLMDSEKFDTDWVIELFENLYSLTEFQGEGRFYNNQFDHYKFMIHELFLYTCAILIKQNDLNLLSELLSADYYIKTKYDNNEPVNYMHFRFNLESLDYRNTRMNFRKYSLHAYLLTERVNEKVIKKEEFIDCDLLLHYFSILVYKDERSWFPITYIYKKRGEKLKLLARLNSERKAINMLNLFKLSQIEELKELFKTYFVPDGYTIAFEANAVPALQRQINIDEIGTKP